MNEHVIERLHSIRNRERVDVKSRREMLQSFGAIAGTIAGNILIPNHVDAAGHGPTALLLDPIYKQHDPGPGHPEEPARYDAVTRAHRRHRTSF